jgi:hypothetical protein
MRHHPASLFTLVLLVLAVNAKAQDGQAQGSPMMDDLCTCMSAIDPKASDAGIQRSVRGCLENIVLAYPGEVRAVLQQARSEGSRAFQLGALLGNALQKRCSGFREVKRRLEVMPPTARPGT